MKLPNNDHDVIQHERENYPTRSSGIIPTWGCINQGAAARADINNWLEGMTDEERAKRLKDNKRFSQLETINYVDMQMVGVDPNGATEIMTCLMEMLKWAAYLPEHADHDLDKAISVIKKYSK